MCESKWVAIIVAKWEDFLHNIRWLYVNERNIEQMELMDEMDWTDMNQFSKLFPAQFNIRFQFQACNWTTVLPFNDNNICAV